MTESLPIYWHCWNERERTAWREERAAVAALGKALDALKSFIPAEQQHALLFAVDDAAHTFANASAELIIAHAFRLLPEQEDVLHFIDMSEVWQKLSRADGAEWGDEETT